MYRDEESVAAEHAADVQQELETLLAPRLAVARRWRPRFWHWVVALVLWVGAVYLGPSPSDEPSQMSWLASWIDHPDLFVRAFLLTTVATGTVLALFFGAMHLPAWRRTSRLLARFGPPPLTMRATERLPLLKRRLADLRFQNEAGWPPDQIDPYEETP
jgi:hypothetical protein